MLFSLLAGCAHKSSAPTPRFAPVPSLSDPAYVESVDARVPIPIAWQQGRDEQSSGYRQCVWVSPGGRTALGIIRFSLPLPVGHSGALWGFIGQMRKSEGSADLLEKSWDDQIGAMRFVARGGRYTVRAILRVEGFRGTVAYAGTLTQQPIDLGELALAEAARERVVWGKDP